MKRIYAVTCLFLLVNATAFAGLAGFAWQKGWLSRDRVRKAMHVLKGDEPAEHGPMAEAAAPNAPPAEKDEKTVHERLKLDSQEQEKQAIELARRETEIRDGWRLLETQQIALLREKETQEEQHRRFLAERKELTEKENDSGLQKEIDIISGIAPKDAKEILRLKSEADAVHILGTMEVRKARKIVSQCKTEEERLWIRRLLEKLHEGNAAQAEVLSAGT